MKKRSLFVATAMLLVAVLVATGATYAWFTSVSKATANLSMDVANGESLEFSIDGGNTWHTSLTKAFEDKQWNDISVVDDNFANTTEAVPTFYTKTLEQGTATITGYEEDQPAKVEISFRASKAGSVVMTGSMASTDAALEDKLNATLRFGVFGTALKQIYANGTTTSYDEAISGTALADEGTQTWKNLPTTGTTEKIVELTFADNYYTGSTNFYFWVEGPLVYNSYTNDSTTAAVALTFAVN